MTHPQREVDIPSRSSGNCLLSLRGVSKSFPGVRALENVDLDLHSGEVLGLLGENGAGKSTLIKILGGASPPDSGEIRIGNQPVQLDSPAASARAGIAVIYQELNLVPQLNAWENVFLGQEKGWGTTERGQERAVTRELIERLGQSFSIDTPCGALPLAQQQVVEIAKALARNARILILDEPTATLAQSEVVRLLQLVRQLQQQGLGIIYVSHRLDEVDQLANSLVVLRDGRRVGSAPARTWSRGELIEQMVGRPLTAEYPRVERTIGEARLEVRQIARPPRVQPISFSLRRGEILGLTGLVGSCRTELARLLFGADRATSGSMVLDGRPLRIGSPRDAIAAGICLLTEDRKNQGLILNASTLENFALPNLDRLSTAGVVRQREEREHFRAFVDRLQIRLPSLAAPVKLLSGGNQQKVVLAKWLERNVEVLIVDEPTRGIDVGAKHELYRLLGELARQGKSILMISSDLPEVIGLADRILVMRGGSLAGEVVAPRTATQEQILQLAVA